MIKNLIEDFYWRNLNQSESATETKDSCQKFKITVRLSRFLIRQFRDATRPAKAVTFFEASGTKWGPCDEKADALSSVVLVRSDASRLIDESGGSGTVTAGFTAINVP